MKKTYLSLPKKSTSFLPKTSLPFARAAAYRSDGGGGDDDDDDDDEDARKQLLKKIKSEVSRQLENRATKEEVSKIMSSFKELETKLPIEAIRAMADEKEGVMAKLVAQGLEIQRLKDAAKETGADMSVRGQIKGWMDKNKESISKIRSGTKADLEPLSIQMNTRALASPMTPATVMPGGKTYLTKTEVQSGIVDVMREDTVFWNFLTKGTTGAETYVWINKKPKEGSAAWLAPGVLKPGISFTINAEISNAKKIAVNEKMATELLQDLEGFSSWVEDELYRSLMEKVNETLMTATASSTVPAGVQTLSVPYGLTGVKTTNPNNYDAIKAAVTQLKVGKFKGRIICFVNPIDYANMVMTKAQSQGQLFIPPATGADIVEDNLVPVGYFQLVAMDYYKVLIYKAYTMSYGWENDDFTKNLVTVIGEMRLHQFHSENHDGFAIYDTFENVIAAITDAGVTPGP
ncbi:MAG: phage major capsid protein [Polynucleobacter sp.]|nr:MAG: phage major capsid protein [Polynucleobacter sp.]